MGIGVKTFKQPFLSEIKSALDKAVSISWEGCHKIYITLDMESHNQQVEYGYEMVAVEDKAEALDKLWEWWDVSCGLRFINAIEGESTFHDVIPQFEYDEEEDECLDQTMEMFKALDIARVRAAEAYYFGGNMHDKRAAEVLERLNELVNEIREEEDE